MQGIGERITRIQHAELLWIGSQVITNPRYAYNGSDDENPRKLKWVSKRTEALLWMPQLIRLKTLVVHLKESSNSRMRRRHETIEVVKYARDLTIDQPNFRMNRELRTLQGLNYVQTMRGMDWIRWRDFDMFLKDRGIVDVRDWSFTQDINSVVTMPKSPTKADEAKVHMLAHVPSEHNPTQEELRLIKALLADKHSYHPDHVGSRTTPGGAEGSLSDGRSSSEDRGSDTSSSSSTTDHNDDDEDDDDESRSDSGSDDGPGDGDGAPGGLETGLAELNISGVQGSVLDLTQDHDDDDDDETRAMSTVSEHDADPLVDVDMDAGDAEEESHEQMDVDGEGSEPDIGGTYEDLERDDERDDSMIDDVDRSDDDGDGDAGGGDDADSHANGNEEGLAQGQHRQVESPLFVDDDHPEDNERTTSTSPEDSVYGTPQTSANPGPSQGSRAPQVSPPLFVERGSQSIASTSPEPSRRSPTIKTSPGAAEANELRMFHQQARMTRSPGTGSSSGRSSRGFTTPQTPRRQHFASIDSVIHSDPNTSHFFGNRFSGGPGTGSPGKRRQDGGDSEPPGSPSKRQRGSPEAPISVDDGDDDDDLFVVSAQATPKSEPRDDWWQTSTNMISAMFQSSGTYGMTQETAIELDDDE